MWIRWRRFVTNEEFPENLWTNNGARREQRPRIANLEEENENVLDCAEILASLFDHVLVPFAVRDELLHPRAPKKVKDWILQSRPWLEITPVTHVQPVRGLHKGETEALQLALERKAAAVLMDDMDGRAAARRLGRSGVGQGKPRDGIGHRAGGWPSEETAALQEPVAAG